MEVRLGADDRTQVWSFRLFATDSWYNFVCVVSVSEVVLVLCDGARLIGLVAQNRIIGTLPLLQTRLRLHQRRISISIDSILCRPVHDLF